MNRQAASLRSDAFVMQYASECRIPAGCLCRGNAAMSQSKAVMVRNAGVARRDESTIAVRPLKNRVSSSSDSISSSVGTTR